MNESHYDPSARNSFFIALSYAVLASAFIIAMIVVWWTLQPSDVIKISSEPIKVPEVIKKSDGEVAIPVKYCKVLNVGATVQRSFVSNATEIFQPEIQEVMPIGCVDTTVHVKIPPQVVPDTYYIKHRAVYQINPIKEHVEVVETTKFRIVDQ